MRSGEQAPRRYAPTPHPHHTPPPQRADRQTDLKAGAVDDAGDDGAHVKGLLAVHGHHPAQLPRVVAGRLHRLPAPRLAPLRRPRALQ